jgi:hypothetical protein
MKSTFFLCFVVISFTALAQRRNETKNPLIGTWKFTQQSKMSADRTSSKYFPIYKTEYFVLDAGQKFKHFFLDADNVLVKVLEGKWTATNNKLRMKYSTIKYEFDTDFFCLDDELLLGSNFKFLTFTKQENDSYNLALK